MSNNLEQVKKINPSTETFIQSKEAHAISSRSLALALIGSLAVSGCKKEPEDMMENSTGQIETSDDNESESTAGEESSTGGVGSSENNSSEEGSDSSSQSSTGTTAQESTTGTTADSTTGTENTSTGLESTGETLDTTTGNTNEKPGILNFDPGLPDLVANGFFEVNGGVSTPIYTEYVYYNNSCEAPKLEKPCVDYVANASTWKCQIDPIDLEGMLSKDCTITVYGLNEKFEDGPENSKVFEVTE